MRNCFCRLACQSKNRGTDSSRGGGSEANGSGLDVLLEVLLGVRDVPAGEVTCVMLRRGFRRGKISAVAAE